MARMYPARISVETKSPAERKLYDTLSEGLPAEYVVFHSVAWLVRNPRGGARDGEADFVIAHPERGILVLEVKGGAIRYDGATNEWFSGNYAVKDPFEQAKGNKYSLLDKLHDLPYWGNRWLTLGHAVAFPDVTVKRDLRLDAPQAIIMDAYDLDRVQPWADAALDYWRQTDARAGAPGRDGIEELIRLLSPSWELRTPLAVEFAKEEDAIIRLTEEQFDRLSLLTFQRRVAISGCAGSGKTTLALERACQLGREGFRVLLTCFNRHVADYLSSQESLPPTVDVQHFHSMCVDMAQQAGLQEQLYEEPNTQTWYDDTLPELLMEACEILNPAYEAIIVDEGQDFQPHWWVSLQCLLADFDQGLLYIFFDDNQNLYHRDTVLPEGIPRFPLTRNCRNTQHIHRTFLPFYHSDVTPEVFGPRGRPPEVCFYETERELQQGLRQVLHRLITEEEIKTEDIVVLTPRTRKKSLFLGWGRLGNLRLTERRPPSAGEVYWTSVYRFKGLESPVVILAELYPSSHQNLDAVLYVGCSRARNHLVIFGEAELPEDIQSRLKRVG